MAITNSERVQRALEAVRDGIRPGCIAAWEAKFGGGWQSEVQSRDRHAVGNPEDTDLAWILKGMTNTWQEVWNDRMGIRERGYVSEIRDARNKWAHQENFSTRDTLRLLDTAERLLSAFSAGDQMKIVQAQHRELQRLQIEEETRAERRKVAAKPTEGQPLQGLKPWREVVTPHPDVATGRLQQAEFAADLYQVANDLADEEYLDPEKFFRRTFLTAGLQQLLVGAAERLSGNGGDPVIDLQTNFGGGKTHSMIALYHLASGVPVTKLMGVDALLDQHKLSLPASMNRAVVAGQWLSPSIATLKPDGTEVHTIWGEIAWQLCGAEGYSIVADADKEGTNPGNKLIEVFQLAGPSIVLIDEWVAYARQLPTRDGEAKVIGGDFETQFTFAQTLTEAAAAVDDVVVLVSIPASDIEVGGEKGRDALNRLTNVVRRKSRQWKPADDDESFEIVRRRLFEPMTAEQERIRDGVIRSFIDYYREKAGDFSAQVQLPEYEQRMRSSYPIHPELFDRLYQDWSTLDRFQRTRGVLRLMSSVISQLWMRDDKNLLIMPGTVPLDQSSVSSELSRYLDDGWDPIIRSDIDGANSLSLRLDEENKQLGRYSATRRVARAVFMATAPRGQGTNGVDLKTIVLGVAQPGESPGTFSDALRRLSNDATYLYVDGAQYWFSARPNIIRTAAGMAASNFRVDDADSEVRRRVQSIRPLGAFKGVHAFPDGPGDVADDDDGVRLVVLPMGSPHISGENETPAISAANEILSQRNAGPRSNRNLLVFLAAHEARINELREGVYTYLAWNSILDKRDAMNLTPNDVKLAESKAKESSETVDQRIIGAFQFVLVPQQEAGKREIVWHQSKPSGNGNLFERIARKLESEERLITSYGGTRVRMELDRIPLWKERGDISVADLWKAYCEFPYLTRLASIDVLNEAIGIGVANFSWESETFAYADAFDGEKWVGLVTAQHVSPRPGGLVVRPTEATQQLNKIPVPIPGAGGEEGLPQPEGGESGGQGEGNKPTPVLSKTKYYGRFNLDSVRAVRQLGEILESVIEHLVKSGGDTNLILEINSTSAGFDDRTQRVVKENAAQLGVESQEFE
jgi:hypothetical protein